MSQSPSKPTQALSSIFRRFLPDSAGGLLLVLVILTAGSNLAAQEKPADKRKRPNILFVFCDDHAYQASRLAHTA